MKKILFLLTLIPIHLQAADTREDLAQDIEKLSLSSRRQQPQNIAASLRQRQLGIPMSAQDRKHWFLQSDATAATNIPISLQDAAAVREVGPTSIAAIFYDPARAIITENGSHDSLPYINSADGLSKVPFFIVRDHPYGPRIETLYIPNTPASMLNENQKRALKYRQQQVDGEKDKILIMDLHNTRIHTILPPHLASFGNVKRVILPTSTPQNIRAQNSKNNPGIEFIYMDDVPYGTPKSRFNTQQ